jgi:Cu(I)/Ag(I) efflux system membrane fusion protein
VTVGIRSEKTVQILDGLEKDDQVVLSGQFLIDSESNLQASFQRMSN